jgi:alpha-tubulin suppressor-like RCC1 family protein
VYTFGGGNHGQIGHGDRNSRSYPTLVGGALRGRVAVAVTAGFNSTAVVMQSGDLYTFGGEVSTVPTLVVMPHGKRFVSASTAVHHTVAITEDGACYTWGVGDYGVLGHGDEEDCVLPKLVAALAGKRVVAVTAGDTYSAAITAEGDLFTWGGDPNNVAMLGLRAVDRGFNSPTPVPRAGGIP